MRDYLPLGSFAPALSGACALTRPATVRVTLDSPAVDVMTDFAHVQAATIEPSASLAVANDYMITRGVRSLFVTSPEGRMLGLITTTDLLGERPMRAGHAHGVKRHELLMGDVMRPAEEIVALRFEDVRSAKVGHIVASLKHAGRHHELVAETLPGGEIRIRGMFSVSQIARQLGMQLDITELASTFAEIEQALVEPRWSAAGRRAWAPVAAQPGRAWQRHRPSRILLHRGARGRALGISGYHCAAYLERRN